MLQQLNTVCGVLMLGKQVNFVLDATPAFIVKIVNLLFIVEYVLVQDKVEQVCMVKDIVVEQVCMVEDTVVEQVGIVEGEDTAVEPMITSITQNRLPVVMTLVPTEKKSIIMRNAKIQTKFSQGESPTLMMMMPMFTQEESTMVMKMRMIVMIVMDQLLQDQILMWQTLKLFNYDEIGLCSALIENECNHLYSYTIHITTLFHTSSFW